MEFFGAQLTLPPEARFGSVPAVQRYVDEVLALPAVRRQWPEVAPLTVRHDGPQPQLTTKTATAQGLSRFPISPPPSWAMRELVVLHEIAHHLCDASPPHGSQYVATLCTLAELVMGPELGHVLRVVYAKEGVR